MRIEYLKSNLGGISTFWAALLVFFVSKTVNADPNRLWEIVSQECVPNQKYSNKPEPCEKVNFIADDLGYAVLRDRRGSNHYLLIPTTRVDGIESSTLLKETIPNYFWEAWNSRNILIRAPGGNFTDETIALAVNSKFSRTQNQLHIHMSCLRIEIREQLSESLGDITKHWSPLKVDLLGHRYWARLTNTGEIQLETPYAGRT